MPTVLLEGSQFVGTDTNYCIRWRRAFVRGAFQRTIAHLLFWARLVLLPLVMMCSCCACILPVLLPGRITTCVAIIRLARCIPTLSKYTLYYLHVSLLVMIGLRSTARRHQQFDVPAQYQERICFADPSPRHGHVTTERYLSYSCYFKRYCSHQTSWRSTLGDRSHCTVGASPISTWYHNLRR
jgi:hypothetical protein